MSERFEVADAAEFARNVAYLVFLELFDSHSDVPNRSEEGARQLVKAKQGGRRQFFEALQLSLLDELKQLGRILCAPEPIAKPEAAWFEALAAFSSALAVKLAWVQFRGDPTGWNVLWFRERVDEVQRMVEAGVSVGEICDSLGISRATYYRLKG